MEEAINKENVQRLLGDFQQFRKSQTYEAVRLTQNCSVDSILGVVNADEGDYLFNTGNGLIVIDEETFCEQFISVAIVEGPESEPS